jgi:HEAT repeat protein
MSKHTSLSRQYNSDDPNLEVLPALIEALLGSEERLAINAAVILGRIGDARAVPALLEAIGADRLPERPGELAITAPDEWSAVEAAVALGKIGDASAVPDLLEALSTKNWRERFGAVIDLHGVQSMDSSDVLFFMALRAMISDLQCAVASALGQIGDERAIPGLIEALRDEHDKFLRKAAAEALVEIGTPQAIDAVSEWRKRQESD